VRRTSGRLACVEASLGLLYNRSPEVPAESQGVVFKRVFLTRIPDLKGDDLRCSPVVIPGRANLSYRYGLLPGYLEPYRPHLVKLKDNGNFHLVSIVDSSHCGHTGVDII